jgi:hypothetical protein
MGVRREHSRRMRSVHRQEISPLAVYSRHPCFRKVAVDEKIFFPSDKLPISDSMLGCRQLTIPRYGRLLPHLGRKRRSQAGRTILLRMGSERAARQPHLCGVSRDGSRCEMQRNGDGWRCKNRFLHRHAGIGLQRRQAGN